MGYKLHDEGATFGTAIGCMLAILVMGIMVVIVALSMSAPGAWDRTPWWQLAITVSLMALVTYGAFRFIKRVSDRLAGGPTE